MSWAPLLWSWDLWLWQQGIFRQDWKEDSLEKAALLKIPFEGKMLFGEQLDTMIRKAFKDRKHVMPYKEKSSSTQSYWGYSSYPSTRKVSKPYSDCLRKFQLKKSSSNANSKAQQGPSKWKFWKLLGRIHPSSRSQSFSFLKAWEDNVRVLWALNIFRNRCYIDFCKLPPEWGTIRTPVPKDAVKHQALWMGVQALLEKRAIVLVLLSHQGKITYSILFLVQKASRSFRPDLDLKRVGQNSTLQNSYSPVHNSGGRRPGLYDIHESSRRYLHVPIAEKYHWQPPF